MMSEKQKRKTKDLILEVYKSIEKEPKSINQIAKELNSGWASVRDCLELLFELRCVSELRKPNSIARYWEHEAFRLERRKRLAERFDKDAHKIFDEWLPKKQLLGEK